MIILICAADFPSIKTVGPIFIVVAIPTQV